MPVVINGISWTLENIYLSVIEQKRHVHNREIWIGENPARNLELVCGEASVMTPFQSTAGNDTWSVTPLCLIGTDDGPFFAGMTWFDAHRIHIMDVAVGADLTMHIMRLVYGTGTSAAAIGAMQFTEVCFTPERGAVSTAIPVIIPRLVYGTDKLWVSHWVDGVNAPTMDFKIGIHEYED